MQAAGNASLDLANRVNHREWVKHSVLPNLTGSPYRAIKGVVFRKRIIGTVVNQRCSPAWVWEME
jgi:hypothetical protein